MKRFYMIFSVLFVMVLVASCVAPTAPTGEVDTETQTEGAIELVFRQSDPPGEIGDWKQQLNNGMLRTPTFRSE